MKTIRSMRPNDLTLGHLNPLEKLIDHLIIITFSGNHDFFLFVFSSVMTVRTKRIQFRSIDGVMTRVICMARIMTRIMTNLFWRSSVSHTIGSWSTFVLSVFILGFQPSRQAMYLVSNYLVSGPR